METRDTANNTRIARRFVIYDNKSEITINTNNEGKFFVSSADASNGYTWQTTVDGNCTFVICITKTCLYNSDPLKPHFYIVKLGFRGVSIIFLILLEKHRFWVLIRTASPRRFLQVPTIYVLSRNMKNIRIFCLIIFPFSVVKFSIYLNRRVLVM